MRFSRLENLIGKDNIALLSTKKVIVFGLGGVGSYAAEALVRSGVGQVDVVDFDRIEVTNINRQIIALENTIGSYKTDVFKNRALLINPELKINLFNQKVNQDNANQIININYDFVLDCIDDIDGKMALASTCIKREIPFMLALGFANKLHPEQIQISTLKRTSVCPFAKAMRKRFRDQQLSLDIPCVYSTEQPSKVIDKKMLGSTAFCPSSAGLMMASYVINYMIKESE